MKKKKPAGVSWRDVKSVLGDKSKAELLKLVADLYSFSADNKSFIHARYSVNNAGIDEYRKIISGALYPDIYNGKRLKLAVGRKAITDYFKATKDELGRLELMTHYFESGNKFTNDFGAMDEGFYTSLESMFDKILSHLKKQSADVQEQYLVRLRKVVSSSSTGWGYNDVLRGMLVAYDRDTDSMTGIARQRRQHSTAE